MTRQDVRLGARGIFIGLAFACAGGACGGSNPNDSADGGQTNAGGIAAVSDKVAGQATDTRGHPVAGVQITVCNPVFYDSCLKGTTGSDGRYQIDLQPNNVWTVNASITKTFNGQSYCLDLEPDTTETFSSASGAVRNFVWTLQGLRPGKTADGYASSYYGAVLDVSDDTDLGAGWIDPRYVQVTLVSQGPIIDGSPGGMLTAISGAWNSFAIGNIPPGRYAVSAAYAPPGGGGGALVVGSSPGQYGASMVIDFAPAQGGTCGNPEATIHVNTH